MRADAVEALLTRTGEDWSVVQRLVEEGALVEVEYEGRSFLIRNLNRTRQS